MTDYEKLMSDAETDDENDREISYEEEYIENIMRYDLDESEYHILNDEGFRGDPTAYVVERYGGHGQAYLVRVR